MDWGCTSTASFSGGRANRKCASISSSPLFIKVALSSEILRPIAQLGWATACSTVAARIFSSGHSRNGPPEAVMVQTSTSLASPEPSTWKIALCSESTGMTWAPDLTSASWNTLPAATTHSLLARATMTPRRMAASAGSIAAAPMMATMTKSDAMSAAAITAARPAAISIPVPLRPFLSAS